MGEPGVETIIIRPSRKLLVGRIVYGSIGLLIGAWQIDDAFHMIQQYYPLLGVILLTFAYHIGYYSKTRWVLHGESLRIEPFIQRPRQYRWADVVSIELAQLWTMRVRLSSGKRSHTLYWIAHSDYSKAAEVWARGRITGVSEPSGSSMDGPRVMKWSISGVRRNLIYWGRIWAYISAFVIPFSVWYLWSLKPRLPGDGMVLLKLVAVISVFFLLVTFKLLIAYILYSLLFLPRNWSFSRKGMEVGRFPMGRRFVPWRDVIALGRPGTLLIKIDGKQRMARLPCISDADAALIADAWARGKWGSL